MAGMTAQEWHDNAMALVDEAIIAKRQHGSALASRTSYKEALLAEMMAASMTKMQPSRAILFRSAASIAVMCGLYSVAESLALIGLEGNPPAEIADELREIVRNTEEPEEQS